MKIEKVAVLPVRMSELPETLPASPEGYTKTMKLHLNFGDGKGAGFYRCFDPAGKIQPFEWFYNSKKKINGFALPGVDEPLTWKQMSEIYPEWLRIQKRAENDTTRRTPEANLPNG